MQKLREPRVFVPLLLLLLLALFPVLLPDSTYEESVLIACFLLAIMASGWNLISGLAGYVSLGHSVYLGIGMYTGAILSKAWGIEPMYLMPLGGIFAAIVAIGVGAIVLRSRSHAFVIITIAVLWSMQLLAQVAKPITGGADGIVVPPPPWAKEFGNIPYYTCSSPFFC